MPFTKDTCELKSNYAIFKYTVLVCTQGLSKMAVTQEYSWLFCGTLRLQMTRPLRPAIVRSTSARDFSS